MIKMSEFQKRRTKLMEKIGSEGVVLIPAASECYRNHDALYPYRQNSDFYYLTGFNEPEAVLILSPGREEGEFVLFNRKKDLAKEIWDGFRVGQEAACKEYLANQAFPISELEIYLPQFLLGKKTLHYPLGMNDDFDQIVFKALNAVRGQIRGGKIYPTVFSDVMPTLHEMRLIKSAEEIALMKKAAQISARAHTRAMQICRPGMYEYELEAELMHEFFKNGARASAYTSIIGSGGNSCVLHYVSNNKQMQAGELVLIDAGAEYQNYAADITRTFPVNGKFTGEQRAIYEIVLAAQEAALQEIKPGVSWHVAQDVIVKILTQGLLDLGILKGNLADLIEQQAYFSFYMHRSGHWLGLDVHDVGQYRQNGEWRMLQPGMVLTVEPGLYLSSFIPDLAEKWHHIGVRIEDDVVVTANGCDILSKDVPKSIADIEALMASA